MENKVGMPGSIKQEIGLFILGSVEINKRYLRTVLQFTNLLLIGSWADLQKKLEITRRDN
jgi:hypothetical protein